jgi:hypothetical protein
MKGEARLWLPSDPRGCATPLFGRLARLFLSSLELNSFFHSTVPTLLVAIALSSLVRPFVVLLSSASNVQVPVTARPHARTHARSLNQSQRVPLPQNPRRTRTVLSSTDDESLGSRPTSVLYCTYTTNAPWQSKRELT